MIDEISEQLVNSKIESFKKVNGNLVNQIQN